MSRPPTPAPCTGPAPAGSPSPERRAEVAAVCAAVVRWARSAPDVVAVGLAGSWARGAATDRSDVDLVVLTEAAGRFVTGDDWVADAVSRPAAVVRTRTWGPLTERRLRLDGGLEVDMGFASPQWAAEPVDDGTARVVADGFRVLHDPQGVLARLVGAAGHGTGPD